MILLKINSGQMILNFNTRYISTSDIEFIGWTHFNE